MIAGPSPNGVVRIGVVADTHVGERLAELPPEVAERLAGVDLILHAGDMTGPWVLERLSEIAPVVAVRGDHDRRGVPPLPRYRVVDAGGYRIGLVHGRRSRAIEAPAALVSLALGRPCLFGFHRWALRRFGKVDCVVHGHLHIPFNFRMKGVLVFSPGAVDVPEGRFAYRGEGPVAWAYLRVRRALCPHERRPAVGIIEAGPAGLVARVLPLTE